MIRKPAVAGSFYTFVKQKLEKEISSYIQKAKIGDIDYTPRGIISPHAGYMYSGEVAGYSYATIKDKGYDIVFVISPSHHVFYNGILVGDFDGYETPLGTIKVARDVCNALTNYDPKIIYNRDAHIPEHALEVQLPFLQIALKDFLLVPIIMGNQESEFCSLLSNAIINTIQEQKISNFVIVASSDLSHFYPARIAEKKDRAFIRYIEGFDYNGLTKSIQTGESEACGAGPVITTMMACYTMGFKNMKVLQYAHSGMVSGDNSRVVGYLSAVIW